MLRLIGRDSHGPAVELILLNLLASHNFTRISDFWFFVAVFYSHSFLAHRNALARDAFHQTRQLLVGLFIARPTLGRTRLRVRFLQVLATQTCVCFLFSSVVEHSNYAVRRWAFSIVGRPSRWSLGFVREVFVDGRTIAGWLAGLRRSLGRLLGFLFPYPNTSV